MWLLLPFTRFDIQTLFGGLLYQPSNITDYRISSNYKNTLPNALNIHNIRGFSFDSEGNPYYKGFSFKMNKVVQPGYVLDENLEASLNTFNFLVDIASQKITDKVNVLYYLWSLYGDDFMRPIIEVNKIINQTVLVCTIETSETSKFSTAYLLQMNQTMWQIRPIFR